MESDPQLVHVALYHAQAEESPGSDRGRLVYEGTARFAEQPLEPIAPSEFELADPRTSKFTAERLYDEQWLFHGPPMQALTEVGPVSQDGISGAIAVLPLAGLTRVAEPAFYTHPITLDTFTHLLGCWGLDCLEQGDVIFPLRMGELSIHGAAPQRERSSLAGSWSVTCSSIAFVLMPSWSAPTAWSGCGSATGKTGGSTGPRLSRRVPIARHDLDR